MDDGLLILLSGGVAAFTLLTIFAYLYLLSKMRESINSNDTLREELTEARAEVAGLKGELEKSSREKAELRKALVECMNAKEA